MSHTMFAVSKCLSEIKFCCWLVSYCCAKINVQTSLYAILNWSKCLGIARGPFGGSCVLSIDVSCSNTVRTCWLNYLKCMQNCSREYSLFVAACWCRQYSNGTVGATHYWGNTDTAQCIYCWKKSEPRQEENCCCDASSIWCKARRLCVLGFQLNEHCPFDAFITPFVQNRS